MGGGWGTLGSKARDAGINRSPPQRAQSTQGAHRTQSSQSGESARSEQSGGMGSAQPNPGAGAGAGKGCEARGVKRPAKKMADDVAQEDSRNAEDGKDDEDVSDDDDDLKPMFLRKRKV